MSLSSIPCFLASGAIRKMTTYLVYGAMSRKVVWTTDGRAVAVVMKALIGLGGAMLDAAGRVGNRS